MPLGKFTLTNQKQRSVSGSDASSVWNFCARFSDIISRGNQLVASPNDGCFLRLDSLTHSGLNNIKVGLTYNAITNKSIFS